MIIVAVEAYNDGNNIQWLFVVVFQGVHCFIFGCFLENIGVCVCVCVSHRVSRCIQVVLLCSVLVFSWGYLIIQERQYFRAFFSGYFSLLFIIIFILLSTSVQSLCTRLGFLQLPHTYITIVSGFVFLDLVDILLSINLPCII